jgi:hypothetical protein
MFGSYAAWWIRKAIVESLQSGASAVADVDCDGFEDIALLREMGRVAKPGATPASMLVRVSCRSSGGVPENRWDRLSTTSRSDRLQGWAETI